MNTTRETSRRTNQKTIEELISGEIAGIRMTQGLLLGSAILMAIPSAMVFLSLTSKLKQIVW